MNNKYVLGVDFGTSSVRCIVCRADDGQILGTGSASYPRWEQGLYCDTAKGIYRQHPLDYIEALEKAALICAESLPCGVWENIVGISADTTGSTPAPIDKNGTPLALLPQFEQCPDAMFHLWKDHCASKEAAELNNVFSSSIYNYTKYQGQYSGEWFWAKILRCARLSPEIADNATSFAEHCDWIVSELCGGFDAVHIPRSACAAGHKALYHTEWNGLPDLELLASLDPFLKTVGENYRLPPVPAGVRVGGLCERWAKKLRLKPGISVAAGSLDSHAGAVGAGIREGTMVSSLGTSSVDMLIVKESDCAGKDFTYAGGSALNSIVPGYVGIESGQAAFGDIFAWFKELLMWPLKSGAVKLPNGIIYEEQILKALETEAAKKPLDCGLAAVDWLNGRRYPYPDDSAAATLSGLSLSCGAVEIYKALLLSAIFGLRRIYESFKNCGFKIDRIRATGGIALKSPYIMQLTADMLKTPIEVPNVKEQTALGAAIYAAVGAGIYSSVEQAQEHMCPRKISCYFPNSKLNSEADKLYGKYILMCKGDDKHSFL